MELCESKKHIAVFNSFSCHREMFGSIINFCFINSYKLTIFVNRFSYDNEWLKYYKTVLFPKFDFNHDHYTNFQLEKYLFDLIFLIDDADKSFFEYFDSSYLKNRTICITHRKEYLYKVVPPDTHKSIYVRPHEIDFNNDWFLPCYTIENYKNRNLINAELSSNDFLNIAIVGLCGEHGCNNSLIYYTYNMDFINRLKTDKRIRLHVIAKNVTSLQFIELNPLTELHTYENTSTEYMFDVLKKCSFIFTDVNCISDSSREINRDIEQYLTGDAPEEVYKKKYEKITLSEAIPLAFSLCIPLIISKQTNEYYKFKNVIEFDKTTSDDIILTDISPELIENERNELMCKFNDFANKSLTEIIDNQTYKMTHKKNYKIFYINLDERTDRKYSFEKHMKNYDLEFERFSAFKENFGPFGCAKSHLSILKNAKNNNYENVIIMEDDIAFNTPPEILDEKLKLIFDNELDFDVFHLSYRYRISEDVEGVDYLKKLSYCHYCSCYIINKKCYDEIIECWEKNLFLLSPENLDSDLPEKMARFSCDISYIPLLRKKNWYCFDKPACVQLNGESDIANGYVNHYIQDAVEHTWASIDPSLLYVNSLQ